MPIPLLVVTKSGRRSTGHIMVRARDTQNNRNTSRDKTLARSNQPRTSETYRHQDDVFGYELRFLLSINRALPVLLQNMSELQATEKTV